MRSLTGGLLSGRRIGGGAIITPPSPSPPPVSSDYHGGATQVTSLGTSILPYCRLAGNQAIIVGDGTYTAGTLSDAPHPANAGQFGGYLVLIANHPGLSIIDMSPPGTNLGGGITAAGDLILSGSTSGIVFIGFKFQKGNLQIRCPDIRTWYCENTFTVAAWHAEPNIGSSNPTGQYHYAPRAITLGSGNARAGIYGAKIHGTGTGIYSESGGTSDLSVVGTEIWDMGLGLTNSDLLNIIHPDCMAPFGHTLRLLLSDSYLHGDNAVSTGFGWEDPGTHLDHTAAVSDVWITNCGNEGMLWAVRDDSKVTATLTRVRIWGCGTSNSGTTDAGWQFIQDLDHSPYGDEAGNAFTYSITSFPYSQIAFTQTSSSILVAQTGTDPATAWITVHPVETWRSFFGWNTTSSGGTGGGTIIDLGSALMPYAQLPGGQVVTLAAGTYTTGIPDFSKFSHNFDASKARNNWLIIVPESPDACNINLVPDIGTVAAGGSPSTALSMFYNAVDNWIPDPSLPQNGRYQHLPFRVMFVGFHFTGQILVSWLDYLRFWHCTFTNPIVPYNDRYREAYKVRHGVYPPLMSAHDPIAGSIAAGSPTGGTITPTGVGTNFMDHLEFYFCDFYEIGDDAIFFGAVSTSPLLYGCRTWTIGSKGYDYISSNFPSTTYIHPDAWQGIGGLTNFRVYKCIVGGHPQHGHENGYASFIDYRDVWHIDTYGMSWDMTANSTGTIRGWKWFGMGKVGSSGYPAQWPTYSSDADLMAYGSDPGGDPNQGPSGVQHYLDDGTPVSMPTYIAASHLTGGSLPSGITLDIAGGKLMSDAMLQNVLNHASAPSTLARQGTYAGLGEWDAWFARSGPVTEDYPSVGWP